MQQPIRISVFGIRVHLARVPRAILAHRTSTYYEDQKGVFGPFPMLVGNWLQLASFYILGSYTRKDYFMMSSSLYLCTQPDYVSPLRRQLYRAITQVAGTNGSLFASPRTTKSVGTGFFYAYIHILLFVLFPKLLI